MIFEEKNMQSVILRHFNLVCLSKIWCYILDANWVEYLLPQNILVLSKKQDNEQSYFQVKIFFLRWFSSLMLVKKQPKKHMIKAKEVFTKKISFIQFVPLFKILFLNYVITSDFSEIIVRTTTS
jgi:hypothetical protein